MQQNAPFCILLKEKNSQTPLPLLVSRGLACIYFILCFSTYIVGKVTFHCNKFLKVHLIYTRNITTNHLKKIKHFLFIILLVQMQIAIM